jgi:AcrR family transcriptional regulator
MSKREYILDIAEHLFNEFGYTAVGVDLIRDKAGVSKTSMYRYFGSKNKLIEAVLIRRHQHFSDGLNAAIAMAKGVEEKLDAILSWHFAWFRLAGFKGCMFMHALAEFKGQDEAISEQAMRHKMWLKSLLVSIFEPGQKDVAQKAENMMAFLEGMTIRAEFSDVTEFEETYRQGAKTLALAHVKTDE